MIPRCNWEVSVRRARAHCCLDWNPRLAADESLDSAALVFLVGFSLEHLKLKEAETDWMEELHSQRASLHRRHSGEWSPIGLGNVKLLTRWSALCQISRWSLRSISIARCLCCVLFDGSGEQVCLQLRAARNLSKCLPLVSAPRVVQTSGRCVVLFKTGVLAAPFSRKLVHVPAVGPGTESGTDYWKLFFFSWFQCGPEGGTDCWTVAFICTESGTDFWKVFFFSWFPCGTEGGTYCWMVAFIRTESGTDYWKVFFFSWFPCGTEGGADGWMVAFICTESGTDFWKVFFFSWFPCGTEGGTDCWMVAFVCTESGTEGVFLSWFPCGTESTTDFWKVFF